MAKSCCSLYVAFSATSFFCVTISVFTQCCFLPALHLSSFAFMLRSRPLSFFALFVPSHFSLFSSPLILRSSRPFSFFGHFKSCSFPVRSKSRLAFLPSHFNPSRFNPNQTVQPEQNVPYSISGMNHNETDAFAC